MKDKLKKYLLPNLPYLFFVYLFDKLCQAVRLAPGLDASEKLLHIGQGFQTAFASSAPSFHALDICVGILGAVLVRLAVYVKGKNAKKYRKGIEYGSARWGTAADIMQDKATNPGKTSRPEKNPLDAKTTYHIGNRSFVVEPVFKEESPDTLGSVLLRLMKSESEKL